MLSMVMIGKKVLKLTRKNVIKTIKEWGGKVVDVPYTDGVSSTKLNQKVKNLGTTPEVRLKKIEKVNPYETTC